jgi:hypothetical protein
MVQLLEKGDARVLKVKLTCLLATDTCQRGDQKGNPGLMTPCRTCGRSFRLRHHKLIAATPKITKANLDKVKSVCEVCQEEERLRGRKMREEEEENSINKKKPPNLLLLQGIVNLLNYVSSNPTRRSTSAIIY